jgi:hypothetical protein
VKKLHSISLILLGSACVQTESPIKLGPTYGLQVGPAAATGCVANTAIAQSGGSLDISANANYLIAYGATSDLQSPQITNNAGGNAGSSTDNDFVFTQALVTYTSTPKLTFAQETIPMAGVVPAQAVQPADYIGMYILGPKAAATLAGATAAGDIEVEVTVVLQGALHSGQAEQSTPFTYPIDVFSSGFGGCPAGVSPILSGPCGNAGGQDGTLVGCCVPSDAGTLPIDCPTM